MPRYAKRRMDDKAPYNYRHFTASSWRSLESAGLRLNERFPDVELLDADNHPFRLSELRGKTVVVETGCLSCPLYVRHISAMASLKERFPEVVFLVLYVREGHPGRRLRAHERLEDKRALALQLYSEEQEHRRVIVDDLDGSTHRALGGLPNMAFVIGPGGLVRRRVDWNDPRALERTLAGRDDDEDDTLALPPRPALWMSLHVLARAGSDAFYDFLRALPKVVAERRDNARAAPLTAS